MTRVVNKHLLPVYDQPMIYYPLRTLLGAGIVEVCVVVGGREPQEFEELLGNGKELGFDRLTFVEQRGEGGIAEALACARPVVGDASMCVILGDNVLEDSVAPFARSFLKSGDAAMVLLSRVPDPKPFGVPSFDEAGRIVEITEKPVRPASNFAVVGVYFYTPSVWNVIEALARSDRGEMEITDVNNAYARRRQLAHGVLAGFWGDAGTTESLFRTSAVVRTWRMSGANAAVAAGGES
jgi:glucose-1-phosphate thymidylyltransferase